MASICKKAVAQGAVIAFRFTGRYPQTSRSIYKPPAAEGEHFSGDHRLLVADPGGRLMSRLLSELPEKLESFPDDHLRSFDQLLLRSDDEELIDDDESEEEVEEDDEEEPHLQPLISAINAFVFNVSALLVKSFV